MLALPLHNKLGNVARQSMAYPGVQSIARSYSPAPRLRAPKSCSPCLGKHRSLKMRANVELGLAIPMPIF